MGAAQCARGRLFCLLWGHQGSWESEIFRGFLKFIKVFGLKKIYFFSKFFCLVGSGPFVRTFPLEFEKWCFINLQSEYSSVAITELQKYIVSI